MGQAELLQGDRERGENKGVSGGEVRHAHGGKHAHIPEGRQEAGMARALLGSLPQGCAKCG